LVCQGWGHFTGIFNFRRCIRFVLISNELVGDRMDVTPFGEGIDLVLFDADVEIPFIGCARKVVRWSQSELFEARGDVVRFSHDVVGVDGGVAHVLFSPQAALRFLK
jgi:hypothetical protein